MEKHNGARSRFPDGFRIMQSQQEFVTYVENASVRVWYSDTPWTYNSHCHSAVEIIVPLKGEVIYTLSDGIYRVQSDEVLIVPPNSIHALTMASGSERWLLLVEPDSLFSLRDMPQISDVLHAPLYLTGGTQLQHDVRELLLRCVDCYNQRDFLWNAMCYSMLLQMYVELGRTLGSRQPPAESESRRMDPAILNSARLFIDQNANHSITLDEVSDFTGFSKFYFSRMFKQQMGVSFSEYLRQRRIAMAEDLLIHTRRSIRDIALSAGFGSIATFNRVFREVRGCTPTRYREIYGDLR